MKTSIRLLLWACCGLLGCGMASCAGVSGNKYGSFPPDYGNTLTRTTADGKITGLPNDLSDRWGQGETDVWDGTEDLSWYTANPDTKIFHIATAEQLAGLASLSSKEDFEGCTILLTANLILNERVKIDGDYNVRNDKKLRKWTPIQNFRGTFDGRGMSSAVCISITSPKIIKDCLGMILKMQMRMIKMIGVTFITWAL